MSTRKTKRSVPRKPRAKPRKVITGKGAYIEGERRPRQKKSAIAGLSKYAGPAGTALGTALGGPVGGMIGGGLGHLAGGLMNHFFGRGDYHVENNCFLQDGQMIEPIVNPHRSGGHVFRRQEYISDIITSPSVNSFNLQSLSVNPGLESSFNWLSQIAANYEEYEFEGMFFEFRTMSADALNSTNTALGQVIMAANYNAASPNFANKQSMENYEGGVSCRPSESMRYFVECAKNKNVLDELYVRQGAVPSGQDPRLYDLCNFQIATNGFQGSSVNVGELWVSYQVVLRKPKLFAALGLYNSFISASPTTGAYTNALPLGSSGFWNYSSADTLVGFNIDSGTVMHFSPPTIPQTYFVVIQWTGTAASTNVPTVIGSNGLTSRSTNNSPGSGETVSKATSQTFWTYNPSNNATGLNPTWTLGTLGTLPSAGTAVSIFIMQLPNTIYAV